MKINVKPKTQVKFSREWSMPNRDTFSIKPIGKFVHRYLDKSEMSIDPFARNKNWATHTNDLDPSTSAQHHMDAEEFLKCAGRQHGREFDLVIFDPPYSPRQISECYKSIGLKVGMKETQNAALYARVREFITPILKPGGVVLSFGWNSSGMGKIRGYEIEEILLVCHGAAHCDTICLAERKLS